MASKASVRFTIDVDGIPRRLFSIGENQKTGRLIINIKVDTAIRGVGKFPLSEEALRLSGAKLRQHHISIHCSPDSPTGNLIHDTVDFYGIRPDPYHHWTEALKTNNKFAFMFGHAFTSLANRRFIVDVTHGKNISLGSYDPSVYTLIIFVMANRAQRPFIDHSDQFNIAQCHFNIFGVTLFWGFLDRVSTDYSCHCPVTTTRLEKIEEIQEKYLMAKRISGMDEWDCWETAHEVGSLIINYLNMNSPSPPGNGYGYSLSGNEFIDPSYEFDPANKRNRRIDSST